MRHVFIVRLETSDAGTFGLLFTDPKLNGPVFRSLELPWRDNARNVSCIPAGTYRCTWHKSPRFGWTYWVRDVPGRSGILFHAGNWAGDTTKGYRTHSWGCILLGKRRGMLRDQPAVLASRVAMREFYDACERAPEIKLTIFDLYE